VFLQQPGIPRNLEKPGIFEQVKNLEMAWDLEPHLENLEFVLQVAWLVIISRAISVNRMTIISEVCISAQKKQECLAMFEQRPLLQAQ